MVNVEYIIDFVNYNYSPFSKKQCIKRIALVWIASVALCLVGDKSLLWMIPLAIADLLLTLLFVGIILKYSKSKVSRYLCDGAFGMHFAVILNLASYRVAVIESDTNWLMAVLLLLLLVIGVFVSAFITILNIKNGKFSKNSMSPKIGALPYAAGAMGVVFAYIFLQGQSQQTVLSLISLNLLIISLLVGVTSLNLLKAFLYMRYVEK